MQLTSAWPHNGDVTARNTSRPRETRSRQLRKWVIPPTGVYARLGSRRFVGREWLLREVDAFLADDRFDRGVFDLVASAGLGKTAFVAHVVRQRDCVHLFGDQFSATASLAAAQLSLAAQVALRLKLPKHLADPAAMAEGAAVDPSFLNAYLTRAAGTLGPGHKLVIVLDAVDEACRDSAGNIYGLTANLPQGVYVLMTRRPGPVLPDFSMTHAEGYGFVRRELRADEQAQLQDLTVYARAALKGDGGQALADALISRSGGMWIYVSAVLDALARGTMTSRDIGALPRGLISYYAQQFQPEPGQRDQWDRIEAPFLAALAAAPEPMLPNELCKLVGLPNRALLAVQSRIAGAWAGFELRPNRWSLLGNS
jgi:hypothetical protein